MNNKTFRKVISGSIFLACSLQCAVEGEENLPQLGGKGGWQGCKTIAQSKLYGIYIGKVVVSPALFIYRGHKVTITEAWMEHALADGVTSTQNPDWNYVLFKLNIDGQQEQDSEMTKRTQIEFGTDDDKNSDRSGSITDSWSVYKHIYLHRTKSKQLIVPMHATAVIKTAAGKMLEALPQRFTFTLPKQTR